MPEVVNCDVLVVGAGTAGVPAAVTAARSGCQVVVVERDRGPGGTPLAMMHTMMCGLFANRADRAERLHPDGIVEELVAASARDEPTRVGRVWVQPFLPGRLVEAARSLLEGTPGIQVLLGATPSAVNRERDRITEVSVRVRGSELTVRPRVVVDCSAAGAVLRLGGVPHQIAPASERQLAGYTLRLLGLGALSGTTSLAVTRTVALAVRAGDLPQRLRFTTFAPGAEADEGFCKLSIPPRAPGAPLDPILPDAQRLLEVLAAALPAFRDARLEATSPRVVEREGRRLIGRGTLMDEDVLRGCRCDAPAARNAWPIERWDQRFGPRYRYLDDDLPWYEVPEACLLSPTVTNLVCAGRLISATPGALASARVMGPAMALGEAAGRIAARRL